MFYKGGTIDHCTHVKGLVAQYSAKSEYNSLFTAGTDFSLFIMLNNELVKKYPDVVPEQVHLSILVRKSDVCVSNNGKDTKNIIHIFRRTYFVINREECNIHRTVYYEGGLQLADIGTNNVRYSELNPIL